MSQDLLAEPISELPVGPDRAALFARLEQLTDEVGHFEPLGTRHWAFFEDAGTTLLVSFETIQAILGNDDQMPSRNALAKERGWSHLCLIADGETWFRDPAVYRHFDRLVDDAFFEDFDQVMFYGAGMGAHAACAFAVAAPGAQVLAMNPRATLDPAQARWDRRNLAARRLDFTSRYGYAPDMLEGAGRVVVIHDPMVREEAMHAALFRAPWVTLLATPFLGGRIEWSLRHMGLLPQIIDATMAGTLDQPGFSRMWRQRRAFSPYLKAILEHADNTRRKDLAIRICRSVTARLRAPYFAKRLAKLTGRA